MHTMAKQFYLLNEYFLSSQRISATLMHNHQVGDAQPDF